jgi:hypothetical protein
MFSIKRTFFTGGSLELSFRRRYEPLNCLTSDSISYASSVATLQ